jgi:hypothetical protein
MYALAGWFVGWSNFCGFVTGPCSVNYALAAMLITAGNLYLLITLKFDLR